MLKITIFGLATAGLVVASSASADDAPKPDETLEQVCVRSLEEAQILMGHSSITITQRYAHLGEDAIKRAVRETVAAATSTPSPLPVSPRPTMANAVRRAIRRLLPRVS